MIKVNPQSLGGLRIKRITDWVGTLPSVSGSRVTARPLLANEPVFATFRMQSPKNRLIWGNNCPWPARSKLLPCICRMSPFLLLSGCKVPSFEEKNFPWQAPSQLLPCIWWMSLFCYFQDAKHQKQAHARKNKSVASAFQAASVYLSNEPLFATFRVHSWRKALDAEYKGLDPLMDCGLKTDYGNIRIRSRDNDYNDYGWLLAARPCCLDQTRQPSKYNHSVSKCIFVMSVGLIIL